MVGLLAWTTLHASVIVQLRVVDGDGATYPAGARATRGLTVLVTDETGQPVSGATVSFRLPEQGPGGTFSTGLKTEVVTTQADGKASIWGMQWNKSPGEFEIRITAVKDQARAGIVTTQYLADHAAVDQSGGSGTFRASHHFVNRWMILAAIAVGAGAGVALGASQGKGSSAATAPSVATTIGSPTIVIGSR